MSFTYLSFWTSHPLLPVWSSATAPSSGSRNLIPAAAGSWKILELWGGRRLLFKISSPVTCSWLTGGSGTIVPPAPTWGDSLVDKHHQTDISLFTWSMPPIVAPVGHMGLYLGFLIKRKDKSPYIRAGNNVWLFFLEMRHNKEVVTFPKASGHQNVDENETVHWSSEPGLSNMWLLVRIYLKK